MHRQVLETEDRRQAGLAPHTYGTGVIRNCENATYGAGFCKSITACDAWCKRPSGTAVCIAGSVLNGAPPKPIAGRDQTVSRPAGAA